MQQFQRGHDVPDGIFSSATSLSQEEVQFLIDIIDASLRIVEQHQFFSWLQGLMQSLVPHEILVCGMSLGQESHMRMLRFSSSRYFNDEHFSAVCDADGGLMQHMMTHWQEAGCPCMFATMGQDERRCHPWLDMLSRHEMRNAAIHGMRGVDGMIKSFFCFSRVPEPFPKQLGYLLQILVPYMDATLSRVLAKEEREGRFKSPTPACSITQREIQILRAIRQGHTNVEIAEVLSISSHTVKNHVRKILAKLGVQTRAQAVVRAIQIGIMRVGDDG